MMNKRKPKIIMSVGLLDNAAIQAAKVRNLIEEIRAQPKNRSYGEESGNAASFYQNSSLSLSITTSPVLQTRL
jgi:hypothetical protein